MEKIARSPGVEAQRVAQLSARQADPEAEAPTSAAVLRSSHPDPWLEAKAPDTEPVEAWSPLDNDHEKLLIWILLGSSMIIASMPKYYANTKQEGSIHVYSP